MTHKVNIADNNNNIPHASIYLETHPAPSHPPNPLSHTQTHAYKQTHTHTHIRGRSMCTDNNHPASRTQDIRRMMPLIKRNEVVCMCGSGRESHLQYCRYTTHPNTTQHNTTQHNTTQHNTTLPQPTNTVY